MAEYIDKQIILDKCQRLIDVERKQGSDVMNYGRERVNQTEVIMEYIEYMAPTADVAPIIHARWVLLDECANSGYYCSNCQKKLVKEGWSDTVKKIKFCPNCGAKMDKESED